MLKSRRTRARLRQVINSYDKMERILSATDQIDAKRTKVVIIGAGIAGLAAAKAFEDANFRDYLLIEGKYNHFTLKLVPHIYLFSQYSGCSSKGGRRTDLIDTVG